MMKALCLVVVVVVVAMVYIGGSPSEASPVTDPFIRYAVIEACLEEAQSSYGRNARVEIGFIGDIAYKV